MASKTRTRRRSHASIMAAVPEPPSTPQPTPPEPTGAPIKLDLKLHCALGAEMVLTDAKLSRYRQWWGKKGGFCWPQDAAETPWYDLPAHLLQLDVWRQPFFPLNDNQNSRRI